MSHDPTEAIRRKLVPEVNQQGVDAESHFNDLETLSAAAEALGMEFRPVVKDAKTLLREKLVAEHGADNVFDTDQLTEHFHVEGFGAPLVVVTRKMDGKKGSLFFVHHPRLYYGFQAH